MGWMMAKVYVSSTIADLKQERQAVIDWLVGAQHQVVHSYRPNSDPVRDSALEDVDTCDLYVLIVGHRYGFQPPKDNPEGLSITRLEFRRAGQQGKPRVALLRTSIPDIGLSDVEDPQKWARVRAFREEVAGAVRAGEFGDLRGLVEQLSIGVQAELDKIQAKQSAGLTGERALKEHWDPRGRGVERAARPGWFFTGRRQALSELVSWLTAVPSAADNVRVVTGGPGSGKSAVLARLVTMSNPRYRADMPGSLAADDPVAALPANMITVAVHARAAPTEEIVKALATEAGAPQADLDGLIEGLLGQPKTFAIAVDALDEADDPPALALALRRLASETADAGVRLLVGTRPGGPHRRLITALGLSTRDDDPALIDLDNPRYLSREDLAEYVRRRLLLIGVPPTPERPDTPYQDREDLADEVADAVADAAYPAFLIGQLVSRSLLLRGQPISPSDPMWRNFPTTVAAAMDQYLASLGSQTFQDQVKDLLRPLAYARGDGLPLDDAGLWPKLATVLARPGRSYTLADLDTLLDTAADYLIETVVTGQSTYYRLYHQALSDRLRELEHPRPVSAEQTIYQSLLNTVTFHSDGGRDWATAHPYLLSQLAGYAADVGQLTSLLDDPGFLVVADPAGLFGALQRGSQPPTGNAQIYRLAYPHLSRNADSSGERASYLQLAARRSQELLADQLDRLPLRQPWTARWIRGRQPHPHYIAGRHEDGVEAVAVGQRQGRAVIVSGSDDETVRVWDLESGEPVLGPLTGHDEAVGAVAVGERQGRPVIVSGSDDETVRVWDLESGELVLGPLTGHDGFVFAVVVGERLGRPVIVSGSDETVRVWDLESGELVLGPLTGHNSLVTAVAVTERDGRPVIVSGGGDQAVRVWDLESGEPIPGPLTGHDGAVDAIAVFGGQARPLIISGSEDWTVRVWDLETDKPALSSPAGHDGGVNAVVIGKRRERRIVVSGGYDWTVRVWDMESGEPVLGPLTGHDGPVHAITVAVRDGRAVIVSGGFDESVRVWDLESGEPVLAPITGHEGAVYAVAVGERHGRPVIVSGGYDRTVRMWDLESGELVLGPLTGHGAVVSALAIGERASRAVLLSGGLDGSVRVWDLESGEPVLAPITGNEGAVYAVAVGERHGRPVIVSGSGEETVRVWDLESGELVLGPLTGHDGTVVTVAVGKQHGQPVIISGSDDDRTVQVWDTEIERPATLRIELDHQPMSVASTADQLVIGTTGELLRIDLL